jgi:hypothetical protein
MLARNAGWVDTKTLHAIHEAQCPRIHRYNDVFGYAEIWWDYHARINVDYFFRADRRMKIGRILRQRFGSGISPKKFYCFDFAAWVGNIYPDGDNNKHRQAILDAFNDVERIVKEYNLYVDLSQERLLVQRIDMNLCQENTGRSHEK